jgi:hypothetical protein
MVVLLRALAVVRGRRSWRLCARSGISPRLCVAATAVSVFLMHAQESAGYWQLLVGADDVQQRADVLAAFVLHLAHPACVRTALNDA